MESFIQFKMPLRSRCLLDGVHPVLITAVMLRDVDKPPTYEASWINNGVASAIWVEEWRLQAVYKTAMKKAD